jgi:hypothetical protein
MNGTVSTPCVKQNSGLLASIKAIWKSLTAMCSAVAFLFELIYSVGLCILAFLMCVSLLSLIVYFIYSLIFK